jgi:hypothetical protein
MQPTRLDNVTCVYCGHPITRETRTREHVIGRRFVPRGMLDNNWNLIVWACHPCNNAKSDLEDDLSAIALMPDPWSQSENTPPALQADIARKARGSRSRRTKRSVADSHEHLEVSTRFGPGVSMTFKLVAPPQADFARLGALAQFQLRAFFYWITYDATTETGRFWPDRLYCLAEAARQDWGNAQQLAFMRAVQEWETRLVAPELAGGFFRVALRRHPTVPCFAWALEWNRYWRLVGFFGEGAEAQCAALPALVPEHVSRQGDAHFYARSEVSLDPAADVLFAWGPDDVDERGEVRR